MAKDATQVRSTGPQAHVWVADVGETEPATWDAPFAGSWVDLGYLVDPPSTTRAVDSSDIDMWNALEPVRSIITADTSSVDIHMGQTSPAVFELYFGALIYTIEGTGARIAPNPAGAAIQKALCFELVDGTNVLRIYWRRTEVSDFGDMTLDKGSAMSYACTLKRLLPASGDAWAMQTNFPSLVAIAT